MNKDNVKEIIDNFLLKLNDDSKISFVSINFNQDGMSGNFRIDCED